MIYIIINYDCNIPILDKTNYPITPMIYLSQGIGGAN